MLHPISKISNRQHNNADNHKVNAALLGETPRIKFPNNRCRCKTSAHNGTQNGLQDDCIQFVSGCVYKLRCNGIKGTVPNTDGNNQSNHKSNSNTRRQTKYVRNLKAF